jgi:hypothetical protein
MRQVEWLEEVLIGATRYQAGDRTTFENDEEAKMYIDAGWCKCTETGETGERKAGASKMTVDSITQKIN